MIVWVTICSRKFVGRVPKAVWEKIKYRQENDGQDLDPVFEFNLQLEDSNYMRCYSLYPPSR